MTASPPLQFAALGRLERPRFVGPADGNFRLHDQTFVFGPLELAGLEVFLREPGGAKPAAAASAITTATPIPSRPVLTRISLPFPLPALPERLGGAWRAEARRA